MQPVKVGKDEMPQKINHRSIEIEDANLGHSKKYTIEIF